MRWREVDWIWVPDKAIRLFLDGADAHTESCSPVRKITSYTLDGLMALLLTYFLTKSIYQLFSSVLVRPATHRSSSALAKLRLWPSSATPTIAGVQLLRWFLLKTACKRMSTSVNGVSAADDRAYTPATNPLLNVQLLMQLLFEIAVQQRQ